MLYEAALARVHHEGFGFHVDRTAGGILELLSSAGVAPGAQVLDVGCGSGLLAARLCNAGYKTLGIDPSPSMIAIARETAPRAQLSVAGLPGAGLPQVDAVVSTGHVLAYLESADAILTALGELAAALRPGGLLAVDFMTPAYCERRDINEVAAKVHDDWGIIVRFSRPSPERFVRTITTYLREAEVYRRFDEVHTNVAVPAERAEAVLRAAGLEVEVRPNFGGESLPQGLVVLVARRPPSA
ncbi:MAG TPA: class I SAM-dependent methyltransferase [Polyangiaceae bacterium]|nr:class I SAM-dependent methyltransferase [Polyangiaceae bacterium]